MGRLRREKDKDEISSLRSESHWKSFLQHFLHISQKTVSQKLKFSEQQNLKMFTFEMSKIAPADIFLDFCIRVYGSFTQVRVQLHCSREIVNFLSLQTLRKCE